MICSHVLHTLCCVVVWPSRVRRYLRRRGCCWSKDATTYCVFSLSSLGLVLITLDRAGIVSACITLYETPLNPVVARRLPDRFRLDRLD